MTTERKALKPAEIAEAIQALGDTEWITYQMLDWLYQRHGRISVAEAAWNEARRLGQTQQMELFAEATR